MVLRLGACLAAFGNAGLDDAISAVSRLGLTVIDLPTDRRLGLVSAAADPGTAEFAALAHALSASGLEVGAVSNSTECRMLLGPYGGYSDTGFLGTVAQARSAALAAARRTIGLAAALGADYARLFLGCPDLNRWLTWTGGPSGWEANVAEFARCCAPLLRFADERGVRLLLEPHPKQVAYDLPSLTAVLDACDGRLSVCLDPANLLALGHDPVHVAQALPVVPAQLQAKDVERAHGGLPRQGPGWVRYGPQPAVRFRPAGWGEVNWRELLSALAERGFTGPVLIEHEDMLSAAADGLRSARDYLAPLMTLSAGQARTW